MLVGQEASSREGARKHEQETIRSAQRQARADLFVGRERELRVFEELLATGDAPRIMFVHGPGGIGKSRLVDSFQDIAEQWRVGFARLDGRLIPAVPAAVEQEVTQALSKLRPPMVNGDALQVLALDHAEQLAGLDGWLRAELIPGLPRGIVLILAGRQRPGTEWRADPGLSALLIDVELGPLAPEEVSEYLRLRGIPGSQRGAVRDFARGHPLALALAADRILRQPGSGFDSSGAPDLIQDLTKWLLRDVRDPSRLLALAACATVRVLNEPLLAAMLGVDDARAEFDWLARQHFVENQPGGLVIHDLTREIVVRDLRARDLASHHDLIRRAASHLLGSLENAPPSAALAAVGDTIYALRHEPHMQRQFPFGDAQYYPDVASPKEHPALAEEVARLEGTQSAAWFEYWLGRENAELMVMRDSVRKPVGLAMKLWLDIEDMTAGSADPALQGFFRHLHRHAPLRGRERAMLVRFMLAHGTHQARTPPWAYLSAQMNGLVFTPGVCLFGYVADMTYDWRGTGEHADVWILSESGYEIGGRSYAIMGHDTRREPPLEWARNTVERILRHGDAPDLYPAEIQLLNETQFREAVVKALHDFHDEAALAANPLLQSPMLRRYTSQRHPDALRTLIRQTSASRLEGLERRSSLHDVLESAYLRQPNTKQRAVAADLNMSERTLRRRLRAAEEQLVSALWELDTRPGWSACGR